MTASSAGNGGNGVAVAYARVAHEIAVARALVAGGSDVDLASIRPAIRELCEVLRSMPKSEAEAWSVRLIELQHDLTRLGQEFVQRGRNRDGARASTG